MTREEALELFKKASDVDEIIDQIYNDFENELKNVYKQGIKDEARCYKNNTINEHEALKSRSCESCKYCGGESKQSFCVLKLMPAHMYEFEFCCNRYEAKEQ